MHCLHREIILSKIYEHTGWISDFKWELNLEEFRAGAVKDLQTFVKAEEYTEENWVQVIGSDRQKVSKNYSLQRIWMK